MLTMPSELTSLSVAFAPLFSKPVWAHAQVNLPLFSGQRDKTTFEPHAACFNCA